MALLPIYTCLYTLGRCIIVVNIKVKDVTADGHFELVFSGDQHTLYTEKNNSLDMGTYNYKSPINDGGAHLTFDVAPYVKHLNTSKDYWEDYWNKYPDNIY